MSDISEYPDGQAEGMVNIRAYDFIYHCPSGKFVHLPSNRVWVIAGVDAYCDYVRVTARTRPVKASRWIKTYRATSDGNICKGVYEQ